MQRQGGVTLVETLVAILLFSAGVIGTVALHAQSLRHVDDANYRMTAAHLASAVIARMWLDDPATLLARYDSRRGSGQGYRDFVALAQTLPGTALAGNAPEISVENGALPSSHIVTVTLYWQLPGETRPHRHAVSAVIGHNR